MNTHRDVAWPRAFVALIIAIYFVIFLITPQLWYPKFLYKAAAETQHRTSRLVRGALGELGIDVTTEWRAGVYLLLLAGVVPLIASRATGRTVRDLGWQRPNFLGRRYLVIALIVSLPFLFWMVQSPTMAGSYLAQLNRAGVMAFCTFYAVNMLTEHLLLHGVVLGLTTPPGRWPLVASSTPGGGGTIGLLRWLGFSGAGTHTRSLSAWLGLPEGCIFPILISALLFGGVHLGKDSRELILSFPGGLAQAYIAIRSGSWLTPFAIHTMTAFMALALMLWLR